ncbi:MAG: preprotein translocase subunit SecE [Spirochaetes bacterium]|nr:preprotein translocase subunit SecE [Spirochaetota bacterium]
MKKIKDWKVVVFIKQCIEELKKVNWPTSEEVQEMTYVVIIFILIFAILLSFADVVSVKLVDWVFGL